MLVAAQHRFTGSTIKNTDPYDKTKTILGPNLTQKTGALSVDKWAGPLPISLGRPMEAPVAIPVGFPHAITFSDQIDYIFFADIATAAATRRVVMYEYNKSTHTLTWRGFITITFPSGATGNKTIRALRATRNLNTTGTVSVSGTAVTGAGTNWQTRRFAAGARIGFGSTDPTQITTWYEIASITNDGALVLTGSAGIIGAGTAFVIEEYRVLLAITNATPANGGLFVVKGLHPGHFAPGGTNIAAADSTDNVQACYWLADASTVLNTVAAGLGLEESSTDLSHFVYVLDGAATTARIYKYDIRAALTPTTGKSTDAFVYRTGTMTVTGNISQQNNGRCATTQHGPGSGVSCFYFVTTTRVYRAPVADILDASITYLADSMVEIPPGGTTTYTASGTLTSIEYTSVLDRFFVMTSGATANRSYCTRYQTNSDPFDHIFLVDSRQIDQSTADSGSVAHPATLSVVFSIWVEGGIAYLCRNGSAATNAHIYTLAVGAHRTYALSNGNLLVSPVMSTAGATKFYRAFANAQGQLGEGTNGMATEDFTLYYRTEGIDDNSGAWTEIDPSFDMSGIVPGTQIQFALAFKILGLACIPSRVFSVGVLFEDDSTDSHYQASVAQSSLASKRFAWRFATAFGDTVPALRVRLYDAVNGNLLVDDDTDTPSGTFEESTDDGGNWDPWTDTDKGNETTYLRYTPATLPDNIKVVAVLTQL